MQKFKYNQGQRRNIETGNSLKPIKINLMDTKEITKAFVVFTTDMETVKNLLSAGWQKQKAFKFVKERNNFDIQVDGTNHPIWKVNVFPKNEKFDKNDWKLEKDIKSLLNLGKIRGRKLYINESNRGELQFLVDVLYDRDLDLIFDDDYLVLRRGKGIKIFKVAASMTLAEKHDGWYIGQKKVL